MPRLIEEWRRGREALLKLSISHPSAHLRELAEGCEKALSRSMSTASMFLADTLRQTTPRNLHDQARKEHDEAAACVERLAEVIRRT